MGVKTYVEVLESIEGAQEMIDMWEKIYKKSVIDQKEKSYLDHCIETIYYLKGQLKALKWVVNEI